MIATAVVAVVLTLTLRVPRDALLSPRLWLIAGPVLALTLHRLIWMALTRHKRDDGETDSRFRL
jgi:hypothetical protein